MGHKRDPGADGHGWRRPCCGHGSSARSTAGFSLVELMTVVSIMAVLAGVAVSALRGGARQRCPENAALALAHAVREARSQALARGRAVGMRVVASRIETFTWRDHNRDGALDWSDDDGDGEFDGGEGEVADALAALASDDLCRGSEFSGRLQFRLSDDPAVCATCGAGGLPANLGVYFFTAPAGVLVNPDAAPCGLAVEVSDPASGRTFGRVEATPLGVIDRAGDLTWL